MPERASATPMAPDLSQLAGRQHAPVHVLMVCTGNICRSPTAHGVLQKMVLDAHVQSRLEVDSAGTHDYHVGAPPDRRAQEHARRRGYDLAALRARQLTRTDFKVFDLVLVMDAENERYARTLCPPELRSRIHRFTAFCTAHDAREVPDPYPGGEDGFEQVLDLVEDGCRGLLARLRLT